MKYLISALVLCLCAGCATRKATIKSEAYTVPGTTLSRRAASEVRTPETVKAYPVGRYTDPDYPDEMHERHTLYRRETSPDWNYLPDAPYDVPLGPTVARSDPSPSYYVKTDSELMNAQQKAYAEALLEQNRAMKKRIDAMQEEAAKVPELKKQIDGLKRQLDSTPSPEPTPKAKPTPEPVEGFSSVEPPLPEWEEGVSDPGEIVLFAESDDQSQAFLISQMRLNDEFTAELAAAHRRNIAAIFNAPILRRKELALLTK